MNNVSASGSVLYSMQFKLLPATRSLKESLRQTFENLEWRMKHLSQTINYALNNLFSLVVEEVRKLYSIAAQTCPTASELFRERLAQFQFQSALLTLKLTALFLQPGEVRI